MGRAAAPARPFVDGRVRREPPETEQACGPRPCQRQAWCGGHEGCSGPRQLRRPRASGRGNHCPSLPSPRHRRCRRRRSCGCGYGHGRDRGRFGCPSPSSSSLSGLVVLAVLRHHHYHHCHRRLRHHHHHRHHHRHCHRHCHRRHTYRAGRRLGRRGLDWDVAGTLPGSQASRSPRPIGARQCLVRWAYVQQMPRRDCAFHLHMFPGSCLGLNSDRSTCNIIRIWHGARIA